MIEKAIENIENRNVVNFILDENTTEKNQTLPEGLYKVQISWVGNLLHIPTAPGYFTVSQYINSNVIPLTDKNIYYVNKKELVITGENDLIFEQEIYFNNINRSRNCKINFILDQNGDILNKFNVVIIPE